MRAISWQVMDILVAFTLVMICQFQHIVYYVFVFCFNSFSLNKYFRKNKQKQNTTENI